MNIFSILLFFSSSHLMACISQQTNDEMIRQGIKEQNYSVVEYLLNEEKKSGNLTTDDLNRYKQLSKNSMPKNAPPDYCVKPGTRLSRIGGRIAYGTLGLLNLSAAIISLYVISDLRENHECLDNMYNNSVENLFARLSLSFAMAAAGSLGTVSCAVACSGKKLIFTGNESSSGIYGLLTVMKKELEQPRSDNDSFV